MRLFRKLHTLSPMKLGRLLVALCACAFCLLGLKSMISLEAPPRDSDSAKISADNELQHDAPARPLARPLDGVIGRQDTGATEDDSAYPGWIPDTSTIIIDPNPSENHHPTSHRRTHSQFPPNNFPPPPDLNPNFLPQNPAPVEPISHERRRFQTRYPFTILPPDQPDSAAMAQRPPGQRSVRMRHRMRVSSNPSGGNPNQLLHPRIVPPDSQLQVITPGSALPPEPFGAGQFQIGPGVQLFGQVPPSEPTPPLPKVTIRERLVHFDLKGAPPLINYYKEIFPLLKKLGATGLLMEYEDMFPYSGRLKVVRAKNAYGKEDIELILRLAKENYLSVIPLVQTFGHLEFVLKHAEFREFREVDQYPQAVCPTRNGTFHLVTELIGQMMAMHPDVEYLHIGADEVFHLGLCEVCQQRTLIDAVAGKRDLFLSYLAQILRHIQSTYPKLRPIIWDDMFHTMTPVDVQTGLGDLTQYVEPMIWSYYPTWQNHLPANGDLYQHLFPNIWGATAFKGSAGETLQIPNIRTQGLIHTSWIDALRMNGHKMKNFRGIVLSGWSRYDHFYPLCELFPVAIPSLAINLQILVDGEMNLAGMQRAAKTLNCQSEPSTLQFTNVDPNLDQFSTCQFPGVGVFQIVHSLVNLIAAIDNYLNELKGKFPDYQMKSGFAQGSRMEEHLDKTRNLETMLHQSLNLANGSFRMVFDEATLNEWEAANIEPTWTRLVSWKEMLEKAVQAGVWPARPLDVPALKLPLTTTTPFSLMFQPTLVTAVTPNALFPVQNSAIEPGQVTSNTSRPFQIQLGFVTHPTWHPTTTSSVVQLAQRGQLFF